MKYTKHFKKWVIELSSEGYGSSILNQLEGLKDLYTRCTGKSPIKTNSLIKPLKHGKRLRK